MCLCRRSTLAILRRRTGVSLLESVGESTGLVKTTFACHFAHGARAILKQQAGGKVHLDGSDEHLGLLSRLADKAAAESLLAHIEFGGHGGDAHLALGHSRSHHLDDLATERIGHIGGRRLHGRLHTIGRWCRLGGRNGRGRAFLCISSGRMRCQLRIHNGLGCRRGRKTFETVQLPEELAQLCPMGPRATVLHPKEKADEQQQDGCRDEQVT